MVELPRKLLHTDDHGVERCWWCAGDPLLPKSPESSALSKALKDRGWRFVGPTTAHAFMQAMGMVNDHVEGCVTRAKVEVARASFRRPSGR